MNNLFEDIINGRKHTAKSPANADLFKIGEGDLLSDALKKDFHSCVAKLLYLARMVRPDIMVAVAFLTTRVTAPTSVDLLKLDRILNYLNGTKDLKFTITNTAFDTTLCMIDASFSNHYDAMSHTGYVVTIGGTPIIFGSSKQKLCTVNSTDAELVAISDKCHLAIKINDFLLSQGYDMKTPVIYQDNTSTIAIIKNADYVHTNKYVHARTVSVKFFHDNKDFIIEHMPTKLMHAC